MRRRSRHIPTRVILSLVTLLYLVPFYILINMSLKSVQDMSGIWALPQKVYLQNFATAWNNAHLLRAFRNTLIITLGTLATVITLGALAAYPLSRYRTRLNRFVYGFIVSLIIVPSLSISVPLYKIMVNIKAINSYWGMILVTSTFQMPIVVFLYTGFITAVPRELDEAGMIDGLTPIGTFFHVILPLLKVPTISVAIFCGQAAWNEYGFSLFFLQMDTMKTVTISIAGYYTENSAHLECVAAGCLIAVLPLIILFFSMQKYFVKGITDGAIKA